jgi:hypothetical protein
VPESVPVSGSA